MSDEFVPKVDFDAAQERIRELRVALLPFVNFRDALFGLISRGAEVREPWPYDKPVLELPHCDPTIGPLRLYVEDFDRAEAALHGRGFDAEANARMKRGDRAEGDAE